MKKVFIIIPWFDPAFRAGGPIRSVVNMMDSYNNNTNYEVFCGCMDIGSVPLENIETNKWVNYNSFTKVYYAHAQLPFFDFIQQFKNSNSDILLITGLFSFQYNLLPLLFTSSAKKIVSVRGMLHPGALSQKKIKKRLAIWLLKLFRTERRCVFHATDETEKQYIHDVFGEHANVLVAGNFPRKMLYLPSHVKRVNTLKLITVSLISPMKNHLLVLDSLQTITASIEYHIVGAVKDIEYWKLCLDKIKNLPPNIKVIYRAEVPPNEITQILREADVFIMPSKSENFGHAIIEALCCGKPVITSFFTPWNNLRSNHAGINVTLEINDIKRSIEEFAKMDTVEFKTWCDASAAFASNSVDVELLRYQYSLLFS